MQSLPNMGLIVLSGRSPILAERRTYFEVRTYILTQFEDLQLIAPLLRAVKGQGYTEPTPIQVQAIPQILDGRDLIGLAQTGTGKTAAFALPVIQKLDALNLNRHPKAKRHIQALVIAPTRELASQIGKSFETYGSYTKVNHTTIFGGVSQNPQAKRLRRGVNVVVGTPGRLLDLMNQGLIRLDRLEVLILDEADRMLDMGFMPDIKRIIAALPDKRQTLLFSATMPPDIQKLTRDILTDPVEIEVERESTTVDAIDQKVFFVEKNDKRKLLQHLITEENMHRTLVFTRTKHGADRLSQQLSRERIRSEAIHGDKSQRAREIALKNFKQGKVQVLVATDVVARGIDVDEISHVVNYDLPNETESYVHRIGRTGRAGASGMAVSFCAKDERNFLEDIERLIQMLIPVKAEHPYQSQYGVPQPTDLTSTRRSAASRKRAGGRNRRSGGGYGRNRNGGGGRRSFSGNGGGGGNKSRNKRRDGQSHNHQNQSKSPQA